MEIKQKLSNKNNYGGARSTSNIKYLVYHFTANDGDTDESNGNYFANNVVKASAHYFVDDNSVTQSVPDNYVAWAVGGSKYANTKGGTFYGICTNSNSISIELCDNVRNGYYDFTPNTLNNAIELGKMIMKKYNIPLNRVIRHYDVTGKICPKPFVDNEKAWQDFKNRLNSGSWVNNGWGWWYKNADGSYPKNEWKKLDTWYYFNKDGYSVVGWQKINNVWYYFDENCRMQIGWNFINNNWYYMDSSGAMQIGWIYDNDKSYYMDSSGAMVTNAYIQSSGNKNYYHWVNDKGEWDKTQDSWDIAQYKVIK